MTRLLFDVPAPRPARMAGHLYVEGKARGVEFLVTCREYMHVEDMLRAYGVPYRCVGRHGTTAKDKLLAGIERQMALVELAESADGMLGFPSPDAARVVFGLGKRLVVLSDTPHAFHVNKLVLPLADVMVAPSFVPQEEWRPYCPREVVTFDGLFEYVWTSRFRPDPEVVKRLGLEEGRYVVFRPEEEYAAYYRWNTRPLRRALIDAIRQAGYTVVYLPRYRDQLEEGVINLTRAVDHLQLAWFSAGVITGGSTMAVEAALLGVPSISYFPASLHIERYLRSIGTPFMRCQDLDGCMEALREALRSGRATPPRLEDPIPLIFEVVERLWP